MSSLINRAVYQAEARRLVGRLDRQLRGHLLDVLQARAYRKLAWDKLTSALRFPDPAWREVEAIHLQNAVELERVAARLEARRR